MELYELEMPILKSEIIHQVDYWSPKKIDTEFCSPVRRPSHIIIMFIHLMAVFKSPSDQTYLIKKHDGFLFMEKSIKA